MVIFAVTLETLWQSLVAMGIIGVGLGLTFAALPGLIVIRSRAARRAARPASTRCPATSGSLSGSGLSITLLRAFGGDAAAAYRGDVLVAAGICVAAAVVCWVLPGRPA